MIRVLYSFQVKEGSEKEFVDVGGALHHRRGGPSHQQFVAVARWETPQDFKKFHDIGLAGSEAQKSLNATLTSPVALQVVEELNDLTIYDATK